MEAGQIHKSRSAGNFTIVPNEALKDRELSFRAKGLLSFLLSLSSDFVIRKDSLYKFAKEGRDAVRKAFNELEEAGYILSVEIRNGGRFKGYNYIVYDSAHLPNAEKPISEKPLSENPRLLNKQDTKVTINLNKEKDKKERLITYEEIKSKPQVQIQLLPPKPKEEKEERKKKVAVKKKEALEAKQEALNRFERFWNAYHPNGNKRRRSAAEAIFYKLSKVNQLKAVDECKNYIAWLHATNKKKGNEIEAYKFSPVRYLKESMFNDEYRKPQAKVKPITTKQTEPDFITDFYKTR